MTVRTDKKIKRKWAGEGACVSIITEPADKIRRISFFKTEVEMSIRACRLGINKAVA